MRQLYLRYVPVKGPQVEGKLEEETLPLDVGETVISAWPVTPKTLAVLIVYTEMSNLRHRQGGRHYDER